MGMLKRVFPGLAIYEEDMKHYLEAIDIEILDDKRIPEEERLDFRAVCEDYLADEGIVVMSHYQPKKLWDEFVNTLEQILSICTFCKYTPRSERGQPEGKKESASLWLHILAVPLALIIFPFSLLLALISLVIDVFCLAFVPICLVTWNKYFVTGFFWFGRVCFVIGVANRMVQLFRSMNDRASNPGWAEVNTDFTNPLEDKTQAREFIQNQLDNKKYPEKWKVDPSALKDIGKLS